MWKIRVIVQNIFFCNEQNDACVYFDLKVDKTSFGMTHLNRGLIKIIICINAPFNISIRCISSSNNPVRQQDIIFMVPTVSLFWQGRRASPTLRDLPLSTHIYRPPCPTHPPCPAYPTCPPVPRSSFIPPVHVPIFPLFVWNSKNSPNFRSAQISDSNNKEITYCVWKILR